VVAVGPPTEGFSNKKMARHLAHGFEHAWVANAVVIPQTFNHTLARNAVLGLQYVLP
jgi:hypothetical protein